MTLPNFIIIGTGRSGTTSLYHYLQQHPQIYMSPLKETQFFDCDRQRRDIHGAAATQDDKHTITTLADYEALFDGVTTERAVGEATPRYMVSPFAPDLIRRHIPDARLIAILRQPVDRAFAGYISDAREGLEDRSFEQVVDDELSGREVPSSELRWPYLNAGFYHRHLTRYYDRFDRDRIRVYLFEDLRADAEGLLRDIHRFLEVDEDFVPDMSVRYNASGLPGSKLVHQLTGKNRVTAALKTHLPEWIRRPTYAFVMKHKNRNLHKPEIAPDLRARLIEHFREDMTALQDLIGRDLSSWLKL